MTVLTEAWRITLGYFGLAIPAGLVCLALWWWWPPPAGKLFPRRRYRPPPWSGFVVLLVFVFTLLWDATAEAVLNVLWGPPAEAEVSIRASYARALAFPFELATMVVAPLHLGRARLHEVGLGRARWSGQLIAGYLGWLVLCPLVFAIAFLAEVALGGPTEPHPLTKLIQGPEPIGGWLLLWFLAVIVAPILEELLFRGLLQGWLLGRRLGSHVGMALVVSWTLFLALDGQRINPALFVVVLLPGYILLRAVIARWWGPGAAEAARVGQTIYATAALFAIIHPTWPHPIPLFFLGLGLGWLAYRTRMLLAPILAHALFNAVTCLAYWQEVAQR